MGHFSFNIFNDGTDSLKIRTYPSIKIAFCLHPKYEVSIFKSGKFDVRIFWIWSSWSELTVSFESFDPKWTSISDIYILRLKILLMRKCHSLHLFNKNLFCYLKKQKIWFVLDRTEVLHAKTRSKRFVSFWQILFLFRILYLKPTSLMCVVVEPLHYLKLVQETKFIIYYFNFDYIFSTTIFRRLFEVKE
jgi:hypothetical protein